MPYIGKNFFNPKPSSFSNKLFFDVCSTLIKIQRESEKTVSKEDFEIEVLQRVSFQNEISTTCQILNWKKYNASDFEINFFHLVGFWINFFTNCRILYQKISILFNLKF